MGKANVSREEIREQLHHDEVMEAGKRLVEWMRQNAKPLGLAVTVILAVLIVWKVVEYNKIKAEDEASITFSKAELSFNQAVYDDTKKPEERAKLLQESVKSVEDIRVQYPNASATRLAAYLEGLAYLAMEPKEGSTESVDKAITAFRTYADSAKNSDDKSRGLLGLAAAYANRGWLKNNDAGDYKSASETYEKVIAAAGEKSAFAAEAKLGQARLLIAQGQNDKAQEIYDAVAKDRKIPDPPKPKEAAGAKASGDMQRERMKQTVRSIRENNSFTGVAKREKSAFAITATPELLSLLEPPKPAAVEAAPEAAADKAASKPEKK